MSIRSWWRKLLSRLRALSAPGAFLCDSCKYDHPRSCKHAERPNATRCDDYRKR